MREGTTLVIATIAPRVHMLQRAINSAHSQSLPFAEIIVEEDVAKEGPAVVRNRAVEKVDTEFICFLDDDDYLLPRHHEVLSGLQGDVRWPWFQCTGSDPFPMFRGRQWNREDPHQIPITVMLRTEAFRAVGGFETVGEDADTDGYGNRAGEDWRLWLALSAAGYEFSHTPDITWVWDHHGANTSGLPNRW